jgi:bacterioferritin-associated ferredoxin
MAHESHSHLRGEALMYVCNCNGIRERDVLEAAEQGATHPGHVFAKQGCRAQCGRCVEEMRLFLTSVSNKIACAAE